MKLIINQENEQAINIASAKEGQDQFHYGVANKLVCSLPENNLTEEAMAYLRRFLSIDIDIIEIKTDQNQLIYSTNKYKRYGGITKNINELYIETSISFE